MTSQPETKRRRWWLHPAWLVALAVVGVAAGAVTLVLGNELFPDLHE